MTREIRILWTDDEIDLLRPHIIFLEQKGYNMSTATNGEDAIELVQKHTFDLIFLDENMPGLSGLETLQKIKNIAPSVPVVMITKSEEENIMDEAIGSKIADYLIKPVNPKQILLSIKKLIDHERLVTEKTTHDYQSEFGRIGMDINYAQSFDEWVNIYKRLTHWNIQLEDSTDPGMKEILAMQHNDANSSFFKFVKDNYTEWLSGETEEKPLLSPMIFKERVFNLLDKGEKVCVLIIDNLRMDQWKALEPLFNKYYSTEQEEVYCSILPTATQYSRNAMFSGLMPLDIQKLHPEFWKHDEEEGGKNLFEKDLLKAQIKRSGKDYDFQYHKINNIKAGKKLVDNFNELLNSQLNVLIYNFIDNLSHARTEVEMIKELANDEPAYRSITQSWFEHSELYNLIKLLSENNIKIVLTTDHGSIRVKNPVKIVGDRNTSTNLRYKTGKSLNYNPKEVFEIRKPEAGRLPKSNLSSSFVFAKSNDFLVYPNNYNHHVRYYKNTFQHGGVSLEEMLIPLICLKPINK